MSQATCTLTVRLSVLVSDQHAYSTLTARLSVLHFDSILKNIFFVARVLSGTVFANLYQMIMTVPKTFDSKSIMYTPMVPNLNKIACVTSLIRRTTASERLYDYAG